MRVVSLAPSATATVDALRAADRLVGVTHHCEGMPAHSDTRSDARSDASAEPAIDAPPVGGWLNPDYEAVESLDPDLVLTSDALQRDVRDDLRDRGFEVAHHEPATLDDVIETFASIGAAVGDPDAGEELAAESRARIEDLRATAPADGAVVYCEEWSDPPMAAGNWVPDVVAAAGGEYPFVDAGERSREIDGDVVEAADPDHVVVHICGKGDRVDPDFDARGWDLDASVHVIDDSLLNQPSPRLLEGIERLADAFSEE
jgi:iron complex transport system substrate-binding protein